MLLDTIDLFGSVTYVDSVIVSDPNFIGTAGSTAEGKRAPYVPAWRSTLGGTYHLNGAWAWTVVGRYQSKIYATLDNTDYVQNVYQAFDPFFVVDTRIQYKARERGSISFGVDNINNAKYHLFHPFPQRTFVVQGRLTF
ncbi:MAG: TonB-dependent receptor [Pseudolabrys sp.]